MANKHRGEIEARLDGRAYTLCLTLNALAELEAGFADTDMLALATRFESGRLSAHDCLRIIGAGLRGAGHDIADDDVGGMQAEGGVAGFVDIVARLLTATFGGGQMGGAARTAGGGEAAERAGPFVHTRQKRKTRRRQEQQALFRGPK